MDCGLAEVLAARAGEHAPSDPRMLVAPAFLDGRARPRADGKSVLGQSLAHHVDTANFTVQWSDESVDPAVAADIAVALEAGWARLVEQDGWPAPVSSDAYLLWVVLDPALTASGFTTTYRGDGFDYPVMYVHPAYVPEEPAFQLSVAVHELGHALQFRQRAWAAGADAWYWEATSEWVAELGQPDADTYAWSTYWYAQAPSAPADSTVAYHQYGMVLLNAYLDEHVVGPTGIRDIWLSGLEWPVAIAAAAGSPFGSVVADMTEALVAGDLREAHLYETPVFAEELAMPGLYGTQYLHEPEAVTIKGDVTARRVGDVLTLTSLGDGALSYGAAPELPEASCGSVLILATAPAALRRRARSRRRGPPSGGPSRAPS
jgi:hypothetical protein